MIQNSPAYDPKEPCCDVCGGITECVYPCVASQQELAALDLAAWEQEELQAAVDEYQSFPTGRTREIWLEYLRGEQWKWRES